MAVILPIISEFNAKGTQKAIKEFQKLEGASAKAQFAIKKAAVPAAAAIAGIATALTLATKAAMEDEAEQAQLALTLQNVTDASDAQVKATEDQISAMSRASGIADTDYRKALEALVRGTKDVGVAMNDMNLVMDISTATGTDSATVADALAKAYQGNFKALRTLSPEMATMIKEGASLEEVMAVLGGTFGGATAAAADTAAGKFAILKNQLDETKESIGAALLPVVEAVLPYLEKFANWAQDNPEAFLFMATAIGLVAAAIVATNIAMALNPFSLIAIGVGLLVAGLVIAYKKFEWFSTGVKAVVNGIIGVFEIWANSWIKVINAIIKGYNALPLLPDIGFISEIKIGRVGSGEEGTSSRSIDIPKMANGGIVNSATLALIGEKGPEAVVPLNGRNSGMGNYTININGGLGSSAEIGTAVVNAIRAFNRQNGPANIAVA
jgi:hypothetical protein